MKRALVEKASELLIGDAHKPLAKYEPYGLEMPLGYVEQLRLFLQILQKRSRNAHRRKMRKPSYNASHSHVEKSKNVEYNIITM